MSRNGPIIVFVLAWAGLAAFPEAALAQEQPPAPRKPGLVFVVGGVGGLDILGVNAQWVLPCVGVNLEVRDFVWTHGLGRMLQDLQDTRYLLHKADVLAAAIRRAKSDDPSRPVYLIGKSGGSGLALAAAEQLPPNTLERIILLSAAVSPTYDLRGAFRATRGEIVSFYSPLDQFMLGWGTSLFGTVDRIYGPSAGLQKFKIPEGLSPEDRAQYDRLVQISWSWRNLLEGYSGGHTGTSLPIFLAREVAPWLKP